VAEPGITDMMVDIEDGLAFQGQRRNLPAPSQIGTIQYRKAIEFDAGGFMAESFDAVKEREKIIPVRHGVIIHHTRAFT
jgi:hypothetical protein